MSDKSCSACNDLREVSPEFTLNGVTDTIAEYLEKNSGLDGESKNCDDLLDINDCLIGNMEDELDAYDVCEWKDFMAAFIPNLYETIKAMVYSSCGQWCAINGLYNGATFGFKESTDGDAYAVAGKGVSFLNIGDTETSSNLFIRYIAGGLARLGGSFLFYSEDFTDAGSCKNFDNGATERTSTSRKGNANWNRMSSDGPWNGGELICEYRIKRSAYPQIKNLFEGFGVEHGAGDYTVIVRVFGAGVYAFGQHGYCNNQTGSAIGSDSDAGHLVPEGWTYIQLRLSSARAFSASAGGVQKSPISFMGIRMNSDEIEC